MTVSGQSMRRGFWPRESATPNTIDPGNSSHVRFNQNSMRGPDRTLCEGLNRSLASVRAVISIPRDCETKQGTSPIYSTCQAVQPAKADPGADIRSHPLVSDPFSSRWPVPYFCPSGATLPGLTPDALGWPCGTAPIRPGDGA